MFKALVPVKAAFGLGAALVVTGIVGWDQPAPPIRGTWALVGEDNATFVISKDSIYYPDHGSTYKYRLERDSLHIRYDGF